MSLRTVCRKCGSCIGWERVEKYGGLCIGCVEKETVNTIPGEPHDQSPGSRPAVPVDEVADPYPAELIAGANGQEGASAEAEGQGEAGDDEDRARVAPDQDPWVILHELCGTVRSTAQLMILAIDLLKEIRDTVKDTQ